VQATVEQVVESVKKPIEKNPTVDFLSTGIDLLDLVLGGGIPKGKIFNLVGDKSSGKTLVAMEFIAYCRKQLGKKFNWFYDDAEAGFSFDPKKLYGFDIMEEGQAFSNTIEEFNENVKKKVDEVRKGESFIYTLDSLDSLTSSQEIKRDDERTKQIEAAEEKGEDAKLKGTYGMEKQKMLSEFFRLRVQDIKNKDAIILVISQVRANIGVMFGEKQIRTGGKALDFYASQVVWLAEVEKHYKKDRVVGITIKVKCKKNKVGLPFRECFLDVLFDFGIDNVTSNIKFLYDLLTPLGKYSKKRIVWDGKEYSLDALIEQIEKNNLEEELSKRVKEKWMQIEDDISSKNRKPRWS
jgi:recombination protein RecA